MDFAAQECEAVNEAASLALVLLQRRHPWKSSCQWSRSRGRRHHFIPNHLSAADVSLSFKDSAPYSEPASR